jgi:preprotein translocase subunit SecE
VASQQHFLFFSQRIIKPLLVVVLMSQVTTIVVAALDFSPLEVHVLSQESEEPKPKEGKNAFDFLEESKFLITDFPVVTFFSDDNLNTSHEEGLFFEVSYTLESPPPEVA